MSFTTLVAVAVVGAVMGQHDDFTRPQPLILMHKQALSQDGQFNYAFAADNGLKQGESINPDGSRSGAYSYVDPNGQTISVRYSAGKDGFKILQGDHIPKPVPLPLEHQLANQNALAPYTKSYDNHEEYSPPSYPAPLPYKAPSHAAYASAPVYRVQEDSGASDYREEEEHTGPHSFGSGYAFQFSG